MNNQVHQAIVPIADLSPLFFDQTCWLNSGIASRVNNVEFMMANLSLTLSLTLKWPEKIKPKNIL
jgi:adenosyl cobinamide kinase/adenosyl cobinamide phosphate guanylyltransferase